MHALVVGGTGMLTNVSLHLAKTANPVSAIARKPDELARLSPRVNPLALDYNAQDRLVTALREAIRAHGPITLAVTWLSSAGPQVLETVVRELAEPGVPFRLFAVRGSRAADPARPSSCLLAQVPATCLYRQVILGFVIEGTSSRWLTHREIAGGVIQAIEEDVPEQIVGVVRPWHLRP